MDYNEINFHKRNRRPVTDNTYQIAAEEWNALGAVLASIRARLANIENIQNGGQGDLSGFLTIEEFEQYVAMSNRLEHLTESEYNALSDEEKNNGTWYFVEE